MWAFFAVVLGAVVAVSACDSQPQEPAAPEPSAGPARPLEPVRVAVAANFAPVMEKISDTVKRETGDAVELSAGSTGKLYAQIENGAPFDLFLSADAARPKELESKGHVVQGSRFVYAIGRLVICGKALAHPEDGLTDLKDGKYDKLSIANPTAAPYGAAARQVLEHLGLWERLQGRVVQGENIAQSYQFVESGAADIGIVARSLVVEKKAQCFLVPDNLHDPIVQEGVVLKRAEKDARVGALVLRLKSPTTQALLRESGYDLPPG
jgi:molybdate transport system substrate-binding protein